MADNVTFTTPSFTAATDEVQVSGTNPLAHVQYVKLVDGTLNGTAAIGGDATNGLDVDVTRVSGQVTVGDGTNAISVLTSTADGAADAANLVRTTSRLMGYNGSTWDRLRTDTTNGLDVDVTRSDVWRISAETTMQNAVSATGNGTSLTVTGYGFVILRVSVTFSATINVEGTTDGGTTWVALTTTAVGGDFVDSITATGHYRARCSGFDSVRARVTWTSGTSVTVVGRATNTPYVTANQRAVGSVAHDGVDAGAPVKIGAKAINHGTNPTSVASADRTDLYANRAGVQFVIGGHPNVVTLKHTDITTAVTNASIIAGAANTRIVVTRLTVTLDSASTVFPLVRIGFAASTTPTTTGVIASHGGVPAGGGFTIGDGSGIVAVSAAADALLVTTTGNATGNGLHITVSYYTISEA